MVKLMVAQCDDLEKLMYLMQLESDARTSKDIDSVSCLVLKKDMLIRQIEVSQQQIARGMQ